MKRPDVLAVVVLALVVSAEEEAAPEQFVVAGYAPEYRLDSLNLPVIGSSLSHALLFSVSPRPNGTLDTGRLSTMHLMQAGRAKKKQPHLRVLVSVGGGGRSESFRALSEDAKARGRFAKALAAYCTKRRLQGADLDWEAPSSPKEAAAYEKLLNRVRSEFSKSSPRLELTMAMHTGGHVQLLRKAATHVDRVHLMAYDMPDADERGRHSTEQAAKDAVAFAISVGIPREKLVLGIPMYGRDTSNPGHAETYRELRPKRRPEDMEDFVGSIFYNGPSTVRRKAAFAAEQGLAGVFFWELGQVSGAGGSVRVCSPLATHHSPLTFTMPPLTVPIAVAG